MEIQIWILGLDKYEVLVDSLGGHIVLKEV